MSLAVNPIFTNDCDAPIVENVEMTRDWPESDILILVGTPL